MKKKIIVIAGPTASRKNIIINRTCKKINGQIVSADSMQIYKDMNIGTAKPTIEEMQGIKHYMLDFLSPDKRFSVSEYSKMATKAIEEILEQGLTPIVVGGTGLYINSLIYEMNFVEVEFDLEYRNYLESIELDKLYKMALEIDPEAMEKISPNDKKRIIRVLEIYKQTNKTKTQIDKETMSNDLKYDYKVYAINMDRQILYDRINKRVDLMIEQGLIEEVENLVKKYNEFPTAMQGLGYKEVVEYLEEKITKEEMVEKIKMETRRYAKRQLTWFRKNKDIIWLDGLNDLQNNIDIILEGYSG